METSYRFPLVNLTCVCVLRSTLVIRLVLETHILTKSNATIQNLKSEQKTTRQMMDFGLIITLLLLLMCRLKFCHFDPTGRTRVARSGGRRQCCHPDGKSHRLTRWRRIDPRRIHQHLAVASQAQTKRISGQNDLGRIGLPGHGHCSSQTQRTRRGNGPFT